MKRLPIFSLFLAALGSFFFLTLGGSVGCGSKVATPTALDLSLQGQWVAERLTNSGGRIVIGFNMNEEGVRQTGVMSVPVVGTAAVISEGTYALRSNNNIAFNFDSLNNFQAILTWLNLEKTRMSLGSDVYMKVSAASANGAATIGGQVRVNDVLADSSVGVGALSLSEGAPDEGVAETLNPPPPDVIVKMRDGSLKRIIIQPETPPAALREVGSVSSLVAQVDHQEEASQAVNQGIIRSIQELESDPDVLSVTPNVILHTQSIDRPTDTGFATQWNMRLLNMIDAWKQTVTTTGASLAVRDVTVAVIDTGIVTTPRPADLGVRLLGAPYNYDFVDDQHYSNVTTCGVEGRGDRTWQDLDLDPTAGPDTDPTDPGFSDFHGTHVAGLIASGLDNGGMVGMAGPMSSIKVLPLRAMGRCGDGTLFDVAEAIKYAAKILPNMGDCPFTARRNDTSMEYTYGTCNAATNPSYASRPKADIINLSLGAFMTLGTYNSVLGDAIAQAKREGVLVIAAAGNQAKSLSETCLNPTTQAQETCKFFPAADSANVLAVGAVYPNLTFAADYSNYTSQVVQPHFLVAPGGSRSDGVWSLTRLDDPDGSSGYKEMPGTSQATPHVTGLAAMMMSIAPGTARPTADQIIAMLESTAIPLNTTTTTANVLNGGARPWDAHFGFGFINPVDALVRAKGDVASGTPHLSVSASQLVFGPAGNDATVLAIGGNGTALTNITATPSTATGGNWLRASVSSALSPARINVQVTRTGLADGSYAGTILVNSSTGSQTINVSMRVSSTQTSGDSIENLRRAIENLTGSADRGSTQDIGTMIISLVDADNPDVELYYTTTDYQADYRFLMGVQPGRYYLKAIVDVDGDRQIGPGDLTFAYPNSANPQVLQVDAGTNRTNLILGR